MLNKIVIGKYNNVESFINSLNPLCKIINVLLLVIMSFFIDNIYSVIISLCLMILFMMLSKISIKKYFLLLKSLLVLIVSIVLINLLVQTSIYETSIIVYRLIFIVIVTSILTFTTRPLDITYGLEKLLGPFKIFKLPVNEVALAISLALRFIPTIIMQADTILKSQSSRGLDYRQSKVYDKLKIILSIILPIFVVSFKKADILADTMIIRQYDINKERTNYRVSKWSKNDSISLLVIMVVCIGVIL